MTHVAELLLQFRGAVTAAQQNFELWCITALSDVTTHRVLGRFAYYFDVAKEAHLSTAIISLYLLLETRKDTVNLQQLLAALEATDSAAAAGVKEQLADQLALLASARPKIAILRNRVYAHRDSGAPLEHWFEQAHLSVAHVRELVWAFQRVTEEVQRCLDGTVPAWPGVHEDDLANMLEVLREAPEPAA